ncbi:hypothetical protein A9F13_01g07898 [Clavispora lusitaniae]|uniref:Uncharacterized protein n=1 Tax=Clavispora lusitaniae TaxID=36911 RepID=A0AA91T4J0_CLALS|nr:hypothetical protein A9F13_01g07898 [Clavispora lusitaniae]
MESIGIDDAGSQYPKVLSPSLTTAAMAMHWLWPSLSLSGFHGSQRLKAYAILRTSAISEEHKSTC